MKPNMLSTVSAVGVFLIVFFCSAAQDWPIYGAPPGKTYIPVVDANHTVGDDYYYGSMIKQVVKGHIPPFPSNGEEGDRFHPDAQRFFPYLLAAIPALITTDARVSIAFARSFPIAVLAGLGTLFATMVSGSVILGIVTGIGSTLYFPFWRDAPLAPGSLSLQSLSGWLDTASYIFRRSVGLLWPVADLSISQDLYRLAIPSIPFALLLTAFLLAHAMLVRTNKILIPLQVSIFIFTLYSYPSHIFLLGIIYATQFIFLYWKHKSKDLMIWHLAGFVFIIGWVIFTGYVQATMQAYFASDAFNAIYNSNGASGDNGFLSFQPALFLDAVINKYLIAIALLLVAAKLVPRLRAIAILIIPPVVAADITIILGSRLSARFLQRGVDHLLWLSVLLVVLVLLQEAWSFASRQRTIPGALKRVLPILAASVAILLAVWPLAGLIHYAGQRANQDYQYVSSGAWDVYGRVEAMVRRPERIAVPDADDLHYLMTYFDVGASAGPMDLTNQPLTDVLAANAAMWRALGLSRAEYQRWAEGTVEAELERRSSPKIASGTPPYVDQDTFLASRIAAYVYYPYTLDVAGIPIAVEGRTNPAFTKFLMSQFDAAPSDLATYAEDFDVGYLLVSDNVLQLIDSKRLVQLGAPLVDTAGHQLYELPPRQELSDLALSQNDRAKHRLR